MNSPQPGHSLRLAGIAALLLPILVARPSLAAWPHSPGINVPICTAPADQGEPKSVSDGAGGAIITWNDGRSGDYDIYAQHVLASGTVDPAWPANGRAICTATNTQIRPQLVSDGAGGAIIAWQDARSGSDYDIYAQHVLASGAVDGAWPADGRLLCGAADNQQTPTIAPDGAGGAIVTWMDFRTSTNWDVYAQRVLSTGAVHGTWPANGVAVCTAPDEQNSPEIISDGAAGAIIAWYDHRTGAYDIYAQRVLASGTVDGAWPFQGRVVCNAGGNDYQAKLVTDGAGGAIITWYGGGALNEDISAQRILASGVVDPAWPVNGRYVCAASGQQYYPSIVSDGAGGAIVAWQDARLGNLDIYACRVMSTGAVDGAWPFDGRVLCSNSNHQINTRIVSDGAGGAIVTWEDYRTGESTNLDVYAQHVYSTGTVDPVWPSDGRALCTARDHQYVLTIVSDGASGAIVAWQDARANGVHFDIYAQHVAPSGYLGNPEPVLVDVQDVPLDQGGKVKLTWTASYLDTDQPYFVDHYWIFRNVPSSLATQAMTEGARMLSPGDDEPLPGETVYFSSIANGVNYSWEFVTSSPAAHFTSTYSYTASTTSDSVGAGNPRTAFLVVAYNASNTVYFLSNPDSGYSVDNLPPITPAPFIGNFAAGATNLHWNPNPEADLANYRLHRGTSAGFVPGPGNLVASPPDTGYADVGVSGYYYKLAAADIHGNVSGYALLAPSAVTAVGDATIGELSFGRPSPNPVALRASVHLALPREARVRLTVHDLAGREVRSLIAGPLPAGERDVVWNLRDATGARVADGIYFMRLEVEGRSMNRRVAVVH